MTTLHPSLLLILALLLQSCAGIKPDYRDTPPPSTHARIYIYRPHVWEVMWGVYEISVQGKPVKRIEDEGYFFVDVPPGKTEIRSHHVSDKEIVALDLETKPNQTYFVKLDPDAEKFSLIGLVGGVLAISSVVAGAVAQVHIENGQGSLSDVGKMIQGERAKESLKSKRSLGHHLLLSMEPAVARKEISECCSSEEVSEIKTKTSPDWINL